MSADGPSREVAHRLFAAEFQDATLSHAESDEERAPTYVVTPTGARVNRLFTVGTLTEVTSVNEDMVRARVVDPTGAFVVYAGQYQPDELAALERIDPPAFVAVTGKARTFEPDDGDQIYTSVRPESVSTVDGPTRDRWVVDAARQTCDRVVTIAAAAETGRTGDQLTAALESAGYDEGIARGCALALEHYDTTPAYLAAVRDLAIDAARVVAGEREEVRGLDLSPADRGDGAVTFGALADRTISVEEPAEPEPEPSAGTADSAEQAVPEDPEPSTAVESDDSAPEADETPSEAEAATPTPAVADTADEQSAPAAPEEPESTADTEGDAVLDEDDPYELDDEARESIESEFETEFASGSDLDDLPEQPSSTEPDEPEPSDDEPAATDTSTSPPSSPSTDQSEPATDAPDNEEQDADVDLEGAVLEAMTSLDDGSGADRGAILESVADSTGADEDAIADALEDALMDGLCYEPAEDRFTAI